MKLYKVFVFANTPRSFKETRGVEETMPFIYENVEKVRDTGSELILIYTGKSTGTRNIVKIQKQNIINYSTELEAVQM